MDSQRSISASSVSRWATLCSSGDNSARFDFSARTFAARTAWAPSAIVLAFVSV
jgi:hypothetical protein